MGGVRVQRRGVVLPAQPTSRQSFFLSNLDIFWQDLHYNERLLFFDAPALQTVGALSGQDDAPADVMEKLKSSLALCLVHFYPWGGRIAKDSAVPPHRLFIDCCDAGVEFVEASCPFPLSRLARNGFQMSPFFEQLCQHPDCTGASLFSSPLLSIQATIFSDGGLALGIAQSHIVADGQSLWHFMVSWGECARGVPLSSIPLHNRERLALPDPPPVPANNNLHNEVKEEDMCEYNDGVQNTKIGVSIDEDSSRNVETNPHIKIVPMVEDDITSHVGTDALVVGTDSLVQCVLNLTGLAIKKLKQEAHGTYTSYEVICAHFWQRLTVARGGPQNEHTFFTVFANLRSKLSPPLPSAYFGNVIMFASASNTVGKLSSESLSRIADRIHNAVTTCQESSLMAFIHWLSLHDNRLAFAFTPIGQSVFMASSPRFPAYQVDFGWGTPACVRSVKVHGDGELVIFGGNSKLGQGDVEICVALPADVLKRLLEDPHFLAQLPLASS